MYTFENDDKRYLDYVTAHPDQYVLNVCRVGKSEPIVLHSASCGTIHAPQMGQHLGHHHFTTNESHKVICESKDEAESSVRMLAEQLGLRWKRCKLCRLKQ